MLVIDGRVFEGLGIKICELADNVESFKKTFESKGSRRVFV